MENYDVIVIGSGIGGLTAALTSARAGRKVLVLEADKQFGGFINPFKRGKFTFDTGIHYLGELGPGQSIHRRWEKLGLLDDLEIREISPDAIDRYVFPDYEVNLCKGADRYRDRLIADFPNEASGLRGFFELMAAFDEATKALTRIRGVKSGVKVVKHVPLLLKLRDKTFSQVLDDFVRDPRLRAALAAPCGDAGLPPSKLSAMVMMGILLHYLGGAYFPVGGTRAVRDAYVAGLERHGATLMRNSPVKRILTSQGRADGVETESGARYTASVIISNAPANRTLGEMVDSSAIPKRTQRKLEGLRYSIASACLFVGTDLQPEAHGLTDANIWHYADTNIDAVYAPTLRGQLDLECDPSFFLTVPTLKDGAHSSHAPEGKHTVELISFAAWAPFEKWKDQAVLKRDEDYKALKAQLRDQMLRGAERYLPGLRDHAEVIEVATPLTNAAFVHTPLGSIYGLEQTPDQVGLNRFRTTTPVENLLLCGADVFGAGVAPCVMSGHAAAGIAEKAFAPKPRTAWVSGLLAKARG